MKNTKKDMVQQAPIQSITAPNMHAGFIFRDEFEVLVKKLYKRLSEDKKKKLWLLTSEIILKNTQAEIDLHVKLYESIQQAYENMNKNR
jgi:hypothetical protein